MYHASASAVLRSKGQNAVASAAYISRSELCYSSVDSSTGAVFSVNYDYSSKVGLGYSAILAPKDTPDWAYDREQLWNKVEESDKRKDARPARKLIFALQNELTHEQNIDLVNEFVDKNLVSKGLVVDVNIHYDSENNPHVHMQMTTRKIGENGEFETKKIEELYEKNFVRQLRKSVADITNAHLEKWGHLKRISHLSHKERGIDLVPGVHEGPARHIKSAELTQKNREILKENASRIRSNPELVFDKLSINKPVFTRDDIAKALSDSITSSIILSTNDVNNTDDISNTNKSNLDKKNLESLNADIQREFMSAYATVMNSDKISLVTKEDLRGRTLYAFTKRVELENRYDTTIESLNKLGNHRINVSDNELSEDLSNEQKQAVKEILSGSNISVLEGLPGAGKTTVMKAIVSAYRKAGKRVLGAAPSSTAAVNLASVTGIEAKNISQWRKVWQEEKGEKFELALRADYYKEDQYNHITDIHSHSNTSATNNGSSPNSGNHNTLNNVSSDSNSSSYQLTNQDVIILDEAGMVELANMDYFNSEVLRSGAKIIKLGDKNQLAAIGMGGAFKRDCSVIGSSKLSEVRRQQNSEHAKATELLGQYRVAEALDIYHKHNCLVITDTDKQAKEALVNEYVSTYLNTAKENKNDHVAATKSVVICAYTNKAINHFNKQVREQLKLAGVLKGVGNVVNLGNKHIELHRGEQIVFGQNSSRLDVLNGEVGTVLEVKHTASTDESIIKVRVAKADGSNKIIQIDPLSDRYNAINYGYALSAHKLQGATVDKTLVYYENQVGYESFNVMMSRHREDVKLYASSTTLEDNVYARFGKDAEAARREFSISANTNNITATGNEDKATPLWLTGLNIGVSKRTNISFASDYKSIGLDANDLIIKDYIDSKNLVINHLKEITHWAKAQEKKDGVRPPLWQHEAWHKVSEYKQQRDAAAKVIASDYASFGDRLTQTNLNYSAILQHAGTDKEGVSGDHKSYIVHSKHVDTDSSISSNSHYSSIITNLLKTQELITNSNRPKDLRTQLQGIKSQLKNDSSALRELIGEIHLNAALSSKQIQELHNEKHALEDIVTGNSSYRDHLFPEYLSRIYSASPQEVITSWNNLKTQEGLDKALTMIKSKPSILNPKMFNSLKGAGLGQHFAFNSDRFDAMVNIEVIHKRFREYENALPAIEQAKEQLEKGGYQMREKEMIATKMQLDAQLPNAHEEEFLKLIDKTISKGTIKAFKELFVKESVQETILNYYNFKNKELTELVAKTRAKQTTAKYDKQVDKQNQHKDQGIELKQQSNTKSEGAKENTAKASVTHTNTQDELYNSRTNTQISKELHNRLYNNKSHNKGLSFEKVKAALDNSHHEAIFRDYATSINSDGRVAKKGKTISCGSLNMDLRTGLWTRYSTGASGDIFHFVSDAANCSKRDSLITVARYAGLHEESFNNSNDHRNPYNTLSTDDALLHLRYIHSRIDPRNKAPLNEWIARAAVGKDAPALDVAKQFKYMLENHSVEGVYTYRNSFDELIGHTVRFVNKEDNSKQVLPVAYCHNEVLGKSEWQLKGFSDNGHKPIYGAEKIVEDLKPILIVEGEKTANKAQELFPEYNVLSWLGGSNNAANADWSILKDREVTIWPDNDVAGIKAAHEIAHKIDRASGYKGFVSIVDPQNIKYEGKQHQEAFTKGWDLGDALPQGMTLDHIKEVVVNTKEEVGTLTSTKILEDNLIKELKLLPLESNIIKDQAHNILWQNKATSHFVSHTHEIIEQAKDFTAHISEVSNTELQAYMKYAIARGVTENAHEFLRLEHGLYRDALAHVSLDIAKSNNNSKVNTRNNGKEIEISDHEKFKQALNINSNTSTNKRDEHELNIKEKITSLQDEYSRKIKGVRIDSNISDKYLKVFEGRPDKQELFKVLSRDVAFIHQEGIKNNASSSAISTSTNTNNSLTKTHQDKICKIVCEVIESYKPVIGNTKSNHKPVLENVDRIKIAEDVHNKVNNKNWWQELASENQKLVANIVANIKEADVKHVDSLLESSKEVIDYIKTIDPKYDEAKLKNTLTITNKKERGQYISSQTLSKFREYIALGLNDFKTRKADAANVVEFLKVFEKELKYRNDLYKHEDHSQVIKHWNTIDEKSNPFRNHIDIKAKPGFVDELRLISYNLAIYEVMTPANILKEFKASTDMKATLDKMENTFKISICDIVGKESHNLQHNISINRNGIKFKDKYEYLDHMCNHETSGKYLKDTVFAKELHAHQHDQELQRQQQKQMQMQQKSMKHDMDMGGMSM